ncbi:STAS domain-containing protein [Thalassobacillus hwangdonensis]|uniref:STAS domain-containing protein n=1 Tax=Thalassobacillus hwangdonensis TaxID=546108 RepID=A0ABW3L5Y8_9BACI
MERVEHFFAIPYLGINKYFQIQYFSSEVEQLTVLKDNFLDMLDDESREKVQKWLTPSMKKVKVEVNVKPLQADADPIVADIHARWHNDLQADIMVIKRDEKLIRVTDSLNQLQYRLNDTNFELLEEKEKLEQAIIENNRLSAPFITLTNETALVPIFGEISVEKLHAIESHLLFEVQENDVDRLLFDFTAVGEMEKEGFLVLQNLIQSLFYMGCEVAFVGIQPKQAQHMHHMKMKFDITYLTSLHQALQKYCK